MVFPINFYKLKVQQNTCFLEVQQSRDPEGSLRRPVRPTDVASSARSRRKVVFLHQTVKESFTPGKRPYEIDILLIEHNMVGFRSTLR